MLADGTRTYTWTSFNQIKKITQGGINTQFGFGAGHERVVQQHSNGTKTIYIGSMYERVTSPGGLIEEKHYIYTPLGRTAVRTVRNDGKVETRYFHQDGLGSICAVTDELGRVEKRFTFDAWGKRVKTAEAHGSSGGGVTRGYTDHEMLEDFGLIHMNGRVYDPTLGRFLSADPYVGSAYDSQDYNRYSYCGNNPLNRTDPSGYRSLGDILKQSFFLGPHILTDPMYWFAPKTFNQYYGQAAGIAVTAVVSYFCGPVVGGAAGGFVSGFSYSLLNGGSIGDAFRSGAIGGAIGAVSGAVAGIDNVYVRALAGAVMNGAIAEATGGEFRHGFYAGLATAALAPSIGAAAKQNWYAGLIMQAVVGGTASAIGGGKFANGAFSAAFQYVVTNVPTRSQLRSSPLAGAGIAGKIIIDRVIGENYGAAWRAMLTEKWVDGPTGGKLPQSLADGMNDVRQNVPTNAAANGMHAWHAGSNAYLANKLGLIGAPALLLGGVFHESPFDWGSFQAEQHWQGTVNHALDSMMDLVANVFGMSVGYLNPGVSVPNAINWGNYIPGPGEPDPAFGGGGAYKGNPADAWGQYP